VYPPLEKALQQLVKVLKMQNGSMLLLNNENMHVLRDAWLFEALKRKMMDLMKAYYTIKYSN
jgi:hypothetical protein